MKILALCILAVDAAGMVDAAVLLLLRLKSVITLLVVCLSSFIN